MNCLRKRLIHRLTAKVESIAGEFNSMPSPLSSTAIVVVGNDPLAQSLLGAAARLGVGRCVAAGRIDADTLHEPVRFHIVTDPLAPGASAYLKTLRKAPNAADRAAPVYAVVAPGDRVGVRKLVGEGYDELLVRDRHLMPRLVHRLADQLGREILYYETATYFGPDRRRYEFAGSSDIERRGVATDKYWFRCLGIYRDPEFGVSVVDKSEAEAAAMIAERGIEALPDGLSFPPALPPRA